MKTSNNFIHRRLLYLTTALLLFCFVLDEAAGKEVKKVGTSAAAFLRIPVGARGAALGGAVVSTVNDPSAMFWNPGGLARQSKYSLMVDHSPWLPGLDFNYVGLVIPASSFGTIGINITSLSTQEMDITTPANPEGTGETFDASFTAVGVSYSRHLTESFSIGGTFKYINERIYNSNATGFAFDIGTIYDTPYEGVRLGFSISNIGTKMRMMGEDLNVRVDIAPTTKGNNQSIVGQLKTDEFDMPLIMRVGLSWDIINSGKNRLTAGVDGINPNDNAQSVNAGAEYALFNEMFVLRAGYTDLFLKDSQKGLALGAGFNTKIAGSLGLGAEYAFQEFEYLGNVNRFTLTLTF